MEKITSKYLESRGLKKIETYGITQYCTPDNLITIQEGSNMIGRDWVVHVDNQDFESIGYLSVNTVEEINKFLDLLNLPGI